MNNLGIICFSNNSGLGYQTKRLVELLRPERVLLINSEGFSKNKKQHPEWYESFSGYIVNGFPSDYEIRKFINGLTHVLCCENPFNYNLTKFAKELNIKVFIQTNWEFNDFLERPNLELPYKFLMPSHWKIEEMEAIYGKDKIIYLPPPINHQEFKSARDKNLARTGTKRFLHIAGTLAAHDRNGTLDLIDAIVQTKEEFELVITSQHELPKEYMTNNRKVKYQIGSVTNPVDLYTDFDALILPRRYGGLCLPMCEALMSAIPTIMTDISPNNQILPSKWVIPTNKKGIFKARTNIDIYQANISLLAQKIDDLVTHDLDRDKIEAFDIGFNNFSASKLKDKYNELMRGGEENV